MDDDDSKRGVDDNEIDNGKLIAQRGCDSETQQMRCTNCNNGPHRERDEYSGTRKNVLLDQTQQCRRTHPDRNICLLYTSPSPRD